jgi:4-hydroxy-3-polyprenylbenzoate decarboxylase
MFEDLRSFIEACRASDDVRDVTGVSWDLEMGALIEASAELLPRPPLLLFDEIPGYPKGFRVASLLFAHYRRLALALNLPGELTKLEATRLAARRITGAPTIPPVEVETGPIFDNVKEGGAVDLWSFPSPRFHPGDGGRYIGTGDALLMRDADSGWINVGTYRVQVHEANLLGLWIAHGQQGRRICERYWENDRSCPVVAVFGADPITILAARSRLPFGHSELDFAGGLRGQPLEVVTGPVTGLPIPAQAEIAVEGWIPPPREEARDEGPFGEWTGYYSGGTIGTGQAQPVIRVEAVYHRHDPILVDASPMWFGAPFDDLRIDAGLLWDQLEAAGVPDVVGVYRFTPQLTVVAIRQRYAGHARQAGLAAVSAAAASVDARYVVVVDEDIDPTNLAEVTWAMNTRVDPDTDIEIVRAFPGSALDPRLDPAKRKAQDYTNSRAIFYAVKPYAWRDRFPKVSRCDPELRRVMVERFRGLLPFPSS